MERVVSRRLAGRDILEGGWAGSGREGAMLRRGPPVTAQRRHNGAAAAGLLRARAHWRQAAAGPRPPRAWSAGPGPCLRRRGGQRQREFNKLERVTRVT